MGIMHQEFSYLRAYKAPLYNCRESSTNPPSFMQNKPKVKYAKMNINSFMTSKYEKMDNWLFRQTKPKQTQFKPKQSQFKPNLSKGQK